MIILLSNIFYLHIYERGTEQKLEDPSLVPTLEIEEHDYAFLYILETLYFIITLSQPIYKDLNSIYSLR